MTKLTSLGDKRKVAATRLRVALLYKKNQQQLVSGTIECMAKFANTCGRFANYCASEGESNPPLAMDPKQIEEAINAVIRRSTVAGNSDRSIICLRLDTNDWVLTITPIFPIGQSEFAR